MRVLLVNSHHFLRNEADCYFFDVARWLSAAGHACIPFSFDYEETLPTPYRKYFPAPIGASRVSCARPGLPGRLRAACRLFHNPDVDRRFRTIIEETRPELVYALHLSCSFLPKLFRIASRDYRLPVIHRLADFRLFCPASLFLRNSAPCTDCLRDPWAALRHRCLHGSFAASLVHTVRMHYVRVRHWYDDVDVFLTTTRLFGDLLAARGIPPRCIAVLPAPAEDPGEPAALPPRHNVVYIGRIAPDKGVEILVEAFGLADRPEARLVLAGTIADGYEQTLRRLAGRAAGRLEIHAPPSAAEQQQLIRASRFVVCPALRYENLPGSIVEAFAAGRAVMASDIGSLPELVEHEVNGWLVDAGDVFAWELALRRALDGEGRPDLERNARATFLREHAPGLHVQRLVGLFEHFRAARAREAVSAHDADALALPPIVLRDERELVLPGREGDVEARSGDAAATTASIGRAG